MLYATLKNKNWGKEDASWVVTTHDAAHDQALSGPGPEKSPEKGPERDMDELSIRCNAVLAEMKANPKISRSMLMEKLNLTEKQVRIAIDHIKATGKAHCEGPRRGGIWIINED